MALSWFLAIPAIAAGSAPLYRRARVRFQDETFRALLPENAAPFNPVDFPACAGRGTA
jgi:hypothetical protein